MVMAVFWTAFIIYGLLSEPSTIPKYPWLNVPGIDKLIHFILFAIEAILIIFAGLGQNARSRFILIVLWCFFLGGILELIQHYHVSGRSGDLIDLMADTLGASFSIVLFGFFEKKNA